MLCFPYFRQLPVLMTNLFCKSNAMTLQLQNSLCLLRECSLSSFIIHHTVLFSVSLPLSLDFSPSRSQTRQNTTEICIQKTHWCTDWCRRSAIRLICMRLSRDLCLTNEMWLVGLMNGSSNQWKVKPVSKSTRKTTVVGNQMTNNLVYVS